jgi:hypothetical protein
MSGRKYSEVELANSVREAIACRMTAEDAARRASYLAASLREAAERVDALRPTAEAVEQALAAIREQLSAIEGEFHQNCLMQLELEDVRRRSAAMERLRGNLEQIAARCRSGENAAAARAEVGALEAQLESERAALEPWLRDVYPDYVERTKRLAVALDDEIRATGSSSAASRVRDHAGEFDQMRAKASGRRAQDAERRYIADAVRRVCTEMGFEAALLPQKSALEDLVVEVNTFAYGILHFRLELGGTIRSQSELSETTCCANFGMIEDKLRSLGVISAFRYEGDQSPVRIEKGAKELPGSEPQGAARGARS